MICVSPWPWVNPDCPVCGCAVYVMYGCVCEVYVSLLGSMSVSRYLKGVLEGSKNIAGVPQEF